MKQLTDDDILGMIGEPVSLDMDAARESVRQLHLAQRIPKPDTPAPHHATLDLHTYTEEQAWNAIMEIVTSGTRRATIITGASGILKIKFQQWARDSLLAPYIISYTPINNGSFSVKFKKQ
ncbi:MAG: Smr/MutS family protein [Muribaculaceae bacterium]|nr:Smr/MutS family protein [Muribaculaceae bacterium]